MRGEGTQAGLNHWRSFKLQPLCAENVAGRNFFISCKGVHRNIQTNKIKTLKPGSAISSGGDTSRAEPPGEFEITTAVC